MTRAGPTRDSRYKEHALRFLAGARGGGNSNCRCCAAAEEKDASYRGGEAFLAESWPSREARAEAKAAPDPADAADDPSPEVDAALYTEGDSIFKALDTLVKGRHPVRLLRLSWLIQHKPGAILHRRQDLPEEAFIGAEELRRVWEESGRGGRDKVVPVVSVSLCWDTPEHPDPSGKQLQLVSSALQHEAGMFSMSLGSFKGFNEMGVFWDWGSLLQGDLSDDEKAAFDCALHDTMDLWHGHQSTTALIVTQHPRERGMPRQQGHDQSGWMAYERHAAMLMRKVYRANAEWDDVSELGSGEGRPAAREWPVGPGDFEALVASRHFAVDADREVVGRLFRKLSVHSLGGATVLDLSGMPAPGVEEAARFGGCLPLCLNLESLDLRSASMSGEALAAALGRLGKGALPKLKTLLLSDNPIGDVGMEALAGVCAKGAMAAIKELWLVHCSITSRGAEALAEAKRGGALPALEVINARGNGLEQAITASLAAAGVPRVHL